MRPSWRRNVLSMVVLETVLYVHYLFIIFAPKKNIFTFISIIYIYSQLIKRDSSRCGSKLAPERID